MSPGQIRTEDHAYIRTGVADVFIAVLAGGNKKRVGSNQSSLAVKEHRGRKE
jgi:hypothetical protein